MKNKFLKLFSLVFIFIMSLGVNNVAFASSAPYYSKTPPSKMQLQNWEKNDEGKAGVTVGKIKRFRRTKNSVHKDLDGIGVKIGGPAGYSLIKDKNKREYFCIAIGVDAGYGSACTYNRHDMASWEPISKIISYGLYNGWDMPSIQAVIWTQQGDVTPEGSYLTKWNEFKSLYNKNEFDYRFYGAKVYKYTGTDSRGEWQDLATYTYKKPNIPNKDIYVNKFELSTIKDRKACELSPDNYSLAGAQYGVYPTQNDANKNTNRLGVITTASDGKGKMQVKTNKTYYVKEIKAPKGYQLDPKVHVVKVEQSAKGFNSYDKPIHDPLALRITKQGSKNNPLKDAEFEISYLPKLYSNIEDAKKAQPHRKWIIKTDAKGFARLEDSYKVGGSDFYRNSSGRPIGLIGTYLIRESKAPKGYKIDPTVRMMKVTQEGENAKFEKFENESPRINTPQHGKISLNKIDKETKTKLNGISFDIKLKKLTDTESDTKEGQVIDTLTIGKKETSNFLPLGEYELIERKDSIEGRGYQMMKTPYTFKLTPNETGSEWSGYSYQKDHPNKVSAETTDPKAKEFILNIVLDNAPQKGRLTLIKTGQRLKTTKIEDREGFKVTRPVTEKMNLEGSKWTITANEDIYSKDGKKLFYKKGQIADTLTTTKTEVNSKELPLGKYILKEVSAPKSYTLDPKEYEIEFTVQNPDLRLDLKTTEKENIRKKLTFNFEKEFEGSKNFTKNPEATFGLYLAEDYTDNGVTIKKDTLLDAVKLRAIDSTDQTKVQTKTPKSFEISEYRTVKVDDKTKPIYQGTSNWEIVVTDRNGNDSKKIFTNEKEKNSFIDEVIDKGYSIKEIKEPTKKLTGYQKKDQRNLVKIHLVNSVEEKDSLEKAFKETNVDYEIKEIPYQGKETGTIVTRKVKGSFEEIPIDGKFYVKEIKTDKDYVTADTKITNFDFNNTKDEKNQKDLGKFTNKLIRLGLNFIKIEEGSTEGGKTIPVKGAVYKLVSVDDKKGEIVVGHYTTDKDGRVSIENLEPGRYYIQEEKAPQGYFIDKNKHYFDLKKDEKDPNKTIKGQVSDEIIPEIHTTAKDTETGKKESNPTEIVSITDVVRYQNLIIGKKYHLKGTLMDKKANKPVLVNGKEVIVEKDFIPEKRDGSIEMIFKVPGEVIRGKETVVFEKLYRDGRELTAHEDIFDEGQTTTTVNPEIGTRLADILNDDKVLNPLSIVKLEDKVFFKDLVVGEKYKLTMNLWNKKTNDYVKDDKGNKLTVEKTFIPNVKSGTIPVSITIDLRKYRDVDLVAFEELTYKGQIMATHKDKENKRQTINVTNPKIKTKFATIDNKKIAQGDVYNITLKDTVKYTGLVPNKVYKMHLTVMDKSTKKPLIVNGKTVETELTFRTPDKKADKNGSVSGQVTVTATTNLSMHKGKDIVAFEKLTYTDANVNGEIVATHEDFDDEDQTITVAKFYLPITGSNKLILGSAIGLIIIIASTVTIIRKKELI